MRSSRCRALFVSAFVLFAACGDGGGGGGTGPDPSDAIASVTVSPPTVSVNIGETAQLSATVRNGRGEAMSSTVTWSSTAPAVASVSSSGLVTGVGVGSTTVRASAGGHTGTASVTGVDPSPPDAPSGVQATARSDTEVDVTWTDNSTNEAEFVIEREPVGAGSPSEEGAFSLVYTEAGRVGANVTTFQDTGLSPNSSYRYRVEACNPNGCSGKAGGTGGDDQTTTHETLVIETASLPDGVVGTAYSQDLTVSGGDGSVAWAVSAGSLPPGLSLSPEGTVSGSPTTPGTFDCTVQATGAGQVVTLDLAITIIAPTQVTTTSLPDGGVGAVYTATLQASDGDGSYTWAITAGALPAGLSLNAATGEISGTPTAAGTSNFTVQVTSAGLTANANLSITIQPLLQVTTAALPDGVEGSAYSSTIQTTGGDGDNAFSLSAGSLPGGLALNAATGEISGAPTAASPAPVVGGPAAVGTSNFTVQVDNGLGQMAAAALSLTINAVLQVTTASLPNGEVGTVYGQTLAASGGDGAYTWSVTIGVLPTGLAPDQA